jgi:hypothetical protein
MDQRLQVTAWPAGDAGKAADFEAGQGNHAKEDK